MRVEQPRGQRGSLKWIQRAVAAKAPTLEQPILDRISAVSIEWRSPLEADGFAEYRDGSFLRRLEFDAHIPALSAFWPARGPQWDALALSDRNDVLLVEAKAHVGELCSPPSQAGELSLQRIETCLDTTAQALKARLGHAPWTGHFYQLGNRLAHLRFLRERGISAYLVLVNFLRDEDMKGPTSRAEWEAAYHIVWHVMGLAAGHPLAKAIIEVFPDTRDLH